MRERPRRRLPSPYGGSTSQRGMNGEAPGPAARKSAEEANPASQAGKGNHGPTTTNSTAQIKGHFGSRNHKPNENLEMEIFEKVEVKCMTKLPHAIVENETPSPARTGQSHDPLEICLDPRNISSNSEIQENRAPSPTPF
ncbi:uncharacterized protein LOC110437336 isoform X1 [Sorghum bicolor]|uniref:uncharacterized protein LOC110437336 isoform X1 n=1 Tax=Sorghum bicolor TaxID=4558 RepID=UPI000B423A7F|nr:uncharacterized protein LOC110437336 isoform X1 [Sorghum bicolor]|eukprot:XP_021321430.1 uncharacterized protein LOC110437336 isoform X1 [Sorghum bicolor]